MEERCLIEGDSPVGHQAYLSPILQFTHRVINKVAIGTGFPCIPTINKRD